MKNDPVTNQGDASQFDVLIKRLSGIRADMLGLENDFADQLALSNPAFRKSAANLLHYLALRRHDVRELQEELASLGLSSLGRTEAHVMATVNAVLKILHHLDNRPWEMPQQCSECVGFEEGNELLDAHTRQLLGDNRTSRRVRVMVTMPSEAAEDYLLVRDLLAQGMDCMRINCAHDDPSAWSNMVQHLERAKRELARECRILMDMAGPKLRTGALEPGPQVVRWRPQRNLFGEVIAHALIWMTPDLHHVAPPMTADACLSVPKGWLATIATGDRIDFVDARGAARSLRITAEAGDGRWAECDQTAYVVPGTSLALVAASGASGEAAAVGELPPLEQVIPLKKGDTLVLTAAPLAGKPAAYDNNGRLLTPARISCTLPEVFPQVRAGERIWFDDGKIGGLIRHVSKDQLQVEITQAKEKGEKLRADKGINLPDSTLRLPALTEKDLQDLTFIAAHADLVGMSFVRDPSDIFNLRSKLEGLGAQDLGIVLKIETRQAFERLPNLVLAVMRHHTAGVMIARGDLAVECGYERLAEVQEEMLWVCEAAHMPVIWATQVLETLAKKGQPSRAEITDAAMGERAECVMLNKGPHMIEAVRVLDDILRRMQAHQNKKMSHLRSLHLSAVHETKENPPSSEE
jgi:pyruvate kinase